VKIRIALAQLEIGSGITDELTSRFQQENPDFICFPEYFFIEKDSASLLESVSATEQHVEELSRLSAATGAVIIGGSLVEKSGNSYYNTAFMFRNGTLFGQYRKINLWGHQEKTHMTPGEKFKIFTVNFLRIGILICADVLYTESFQFYRENPVDIIFAPVTSIFKEADTKHTKIIRDNKIWLAGAEIAGCHVVKVSGVGRMFGKKLLGRSLVVSPERILFRNSSDNEEKKGIIVTELDI